MELEFYLRLKLEALEMASTPGNIGGLDFSQLISAVGTVTTSLQSVVTRLQNVAPQAGSTDAASSQAAQTEINQLADQLNAAVQSLNQVNNAAQAAAGGQTQPPAPAPAPATPVPAATPAPVPVSTPAPADTTTGASAATPAAPPAAPAAPATTPAGPTETGGNVPPGSTTPGA